MKTSKPADRSGWRRFVGLSMSALALVGLIATSVIAPPVPPTATAASTATLPRTAFAKATIAGWQLAGAESIAEVGAQVGAAADGTIALGIDAPVLSSPRNAATTTLSVQPGVTYKFSARVRVISKIASAKGIAKITVGKLAVALPQMSATWKTISGTYAATEASPTLAIHLSKAVRGLSIDDVKLLAPDGTNVVLNPSFEDVVVARGIANTSLVTTTNTAAVALALPLGKTGWQILRGTKPIASGTIAVKAKLTALPLKVSQGFYTLRVRASDNELITTTVIVIDSPSPWVAPDQRYGVGLHVESGVYEHSARYTRSLGITQARNDVQWRYVEPKKKGAFDFSRYDLPFAALKAQGIRVLAIAGYGNQLYGSANKAAPTNSAGIAAYARYAAAVSKRYELVGLEVYNEFNHGSHNKSGKTASKYYLPLLKSVNSAVSKVKPKLPIVAGATARYVPSWFDPLWKSGGLKYTDVVSFHPYEITSKPELLTGIMSKARASMKKNGKATKPIWITELGTSSRIGNRNPVEQASVFMRSSVTAFASGAQKFYWYDLINDTGDAKDQMSNFGLYSHPTKATDAGIVSAVQPKAAAFAQVLTITQLGGRGFRTTEKLGAGVVSQAFGKTTDTVRVVWAPSGTKTATIKTSKPVVVVKFDGTKTTSKPKSGVVKIKVTKNPVFIRSGKATAGVTR